MSIKQKKLLKLDWNKVHGMVPTIIQDYLSNEILMHGYMNEEALLKTQKEGFVTFYSRGKKRLWTKGETSGNFLKVIEITTDCDNDSLLILAEPTDVYKRQVLGICLGMQIFCHFSEECNGTNTIGILNDCSTILLKSSKLSLPHVGWNYITFDKIHPLFKNIERDSRFYFVHSYIVPVNKYTLATTNYEICFSSVIQKNNFFGVQFHPEKSGDVGAQLLKNFLEI